MDPFFDLLDICLYHISTDIFENDHLILSSPDARFTLCGSLRPLIFQVLPMLPHSFFRSVPDAGGTDPGSLLYSECTPRASARSASDTSGKHGNTACLDLYIAICYSFSPWMVLMTFFSS